MQEAQRVYYSSAVLSARYSDTAARLLHTLGARHSTWLPEALMGTAQAVQKSIFVLLVFSSQAKQLSNDLSKPLRGDPMRHTNTEQDPEATGAKHRAILLYRSAVVGALRQLHLAAAPLPMASRIGSSGQVQSLRSVVSTIRS